MNEQDTSVTFNSPGANSSNVSSKHGWAVAIDGVVEETYGSRDSARTHAKWLRNHPVIRDRVQFGHGGVVRVIDRRPTHS